MSLEDPRETGLLEPFGLTRSIIKEVRGQDPFGPQEGSYDPTFGPVLEGLAPLAFVPGTFVIDVVLLPLTVIKKLFRASIKEGT